DRPAPHSSTPPDLLGRWFWGPRPYTLTSHNGGDLELTPEGNGRGSRFTPSGRDHWVGHDEYFTGETLQICRRPDTTYLDLGTFRLTRAPYDPGSDIPGGVDPAGWY
ncbi:MAG: serine hydrolase, partial [Allobranchiibius sp.]